MSFKRTSQSAHCGLTQTDSACDTTQKLLNTLPSSRPVNNRHASQDSVLDNMDNLLRDTPGVQHKSQAVVRMSSGANHTDLKRPEDRLSNSDSSTPGQCMVTLETGRPEELINISTASIEDNYVKFHPPILDVAEGSLTTLQFSDYRLNEKYNVGTEFLEGHMSGSRHRIVRAEAESSASHAYEEVACASQSKSSADVVLEQRIGVDTELDPRAKIEKLVIERERLVYKLVEFVESHGHSQDQIQVLKKETLTLKQQWEAAEVDRRTLTAKLMDSVRENQLLRATLERNQSELAKLLPTDVERGSNKDPIANFDETVQHFCRMLSQALQIALSQQQELQAMSQVSQRQSAIVDELQQRYSTTMKQRGHSAEGTVLLPMVTSSTVSSNSAPAIPSTERKFPIIADVVNNVAHPIVNNIATASPSPGSILQQTEQPNIAAKSEQSRQASSVSAERKNVFESSRPPANRSTTLVGGGDPSYTASASHEIKRTKTASGQNPSSSSSSSWDAGVQMKYPPVNSCPICQLPIPMEASSPVAFARHVDECLLRVTREVPCTSPPPPSSAVAVRPRVNNNYDPMVCPVCRGRFPADKFSFDEFALHVEEHFNDDPSPIEDEFTVIDK